MITEPFSAWWCCLNPRERQTLAVLASAWFANPTYIHYDVYVALTTLTGLNSSINMLEYFELHYGLEHVLIPCGEDCVIDAEVFIGDFWSFLYEFSLTDEFICAVPCSYLTFPN